MDAVQDRTTTDEGFIRRYMFNETTNRPNQVLVCLTCGAEKPKLTKMLRHLNVHKKGSRICVEEAVGVFE